MSSQQPWPARKLPPHQLTRWFNERFEANNLSLTELDEIDGADGDGFRLIFYALNALEGRVRPYGVRHLRYPAWTYECTLATSIRSYPPVCLLHVPSSCFDKAPRSEIDRLEVALEHTWRRLRSRREGRISHILIFSWRSKKIRRGLLKLQHDFERERRILIELRTWEDVQELKSSVSHYGGQITADDLKALVRDIPGFDIEILEFFGISTVSGPDLT